MDGFSKAAMYPSLCVRGLLCSEPWGALTDSRLRGDWRNQPLPAATGIMLPPLQTLKQNIHGYHSTAYPSADHPLTRTQHVSDSRESPPYTPTQWDPASPTYQDHSAQLMLTYGRLAASLSSSGYGSPHISSPASHDPFHHPQCNTISPSTIAAWRAEQDRARPLPTLIPASVFASPERSELDDEPTSPLTEYYREDELSSLQTLPLSSVQHFMEAESHPEAKIGEEEDDGDAESEAQSANLDPISDGAEDETTADVNGVRYTSNSEVKITGMVCRKHFPRCCANRALYSSDASATTAPIRSRPAGGRVS